MKEMITVFTETRHRDKPCPSRSVLTLMVFNVYFSVVNLWLEPYMALPASELTADRSSQLIGSDPRSAAARCSPQQHVTLSLRVA
ncbi:hypothetical protein EYF80_015806 [Liparis tanakae]|uniref:Uncharacterized protein n=1 Tax=Liparis tanakae TaxID=230148 RepID=A0A4Z2I9A0_9TELE|nr:hypothetical protein EYF80_015806 [Liparis tanakae]